MVKMPKINSLHVLCVGTVVASVSLCWCSLICWLCTTFRQSYSSCEDEIWEREERRKGEGENTCTY